MVLPVSTHCRRLAGREFRLENSNLSQPPFNQQRPGCDRISRAPQPEGVSAFCEEVHLGMRSSPMKRPRVNNAVADIIDRIIPRLQNESRRRILADVEIGVDDTSRPANVARVECHSEVGPAADLIHGVNWLVGIAEHVAGLRNQEPSRGHTDYADFVRIDVQFAGFSPNKSDRSLRVLERSGDLRHNTAIASLVPVISALGNAILEQYASDPFRRLQSQISVPSRSIART
jgi:hypothetical protein